MTSNKVNINRISYGILCVVIGFLFAFYLDVLTFGLLFFVLAAPWISIAIRGHLAKNVKVKIEFKERMVKQNEEAHLVITLENQGIFPMTNAMAKMIIRNSYDEKAYEYFVDFNVRGGKEVFVEMVPVSETCALLTAECVGVYVGDYLRLYREKLINVEAHSECYVFPHKEKLELGNAFGKDDEEEDNREVIGEDVSEIVDIREFRAGDRMSRIHWKLTTKCDELMVKEYGPELGSKMVVGMDLWEEEDYVKLDNVLVTVFNVGEALVECGRTFTLKWYDGFASDYQVREIDTKSALTEAFKDILGSKLVASRGMFYNNEKEVNKQRFLYITNKDNLDTFQGEIMGITDREVVLLWV